MLGREPSGQAPASHPPTRRPRPSATTESIVPSNRNDHCLPCPAGPAPVGKGPIVGRPCVCPRGPWPSLAALQPPPNDGGGGCESEEQQGTGALGPFDRSTDRLLSTDRSINRSTTQSIHSMAWHRSYLPPSQTPSAVRPFRPRAVAEQRLRSRTPPAAHTTTQVCGVRWPGRGSGRVFLPSQYHLVAAAAAAFPSFCDRSRAGSGRSIDRLKYGERAAVGRGASIEADDMMRRPCIGYHSASRRRQARLRPNTHTAYQRAAMRFMASAIRRSAEHARRE